MKIIFFGTPEFAVPSLEILVKNGYDVVGVVTAPGKKAGRGLQVREPAVKQYADSQGLTVFQPVRLGDPSFLESLKILQADLFVVVAFRMLPEVVWKMPPLGTFNLHSSLLPHYRGAAPINRVIMNGETETGVTTFFLQHEIDTGKIIFREKVAILPDETAGELHDKLMIQGAALLLKTVKAIENGTAAAVEQSTLSDRTEPLKAAPKIFAADCQLNWNGTAGHLNNQVRGLSPFPGAFTWLEDASGNKMLLKIYRSVITGIKTLHGPGTIVAESNRLYVECSDNRLEILEVQQEGKKRIKAEDFVKGFRSEKGWKAVSN